VTDHPTPAAPNDVANDDQPAPVFNADVPHATPERPLSEVARRVLLEAASVPLDDVFEQNAKMYEGENSEDDVARHAAEWIEENRAEVDEWLAAARDAAS